MPQYQTRAAGHEPKVYAAQRPSGAACKAFTVYRKMHPNTNVLAVEVQTEGKLTWTTFDVTYEEVEDSFFGKLQRPVAVKRIVEV